MLVGYGLVGGLGGPGHALPNSPLTGESLIGMLERLGVNTRDEINNLKTDNVAAVMVTATLPPFTRQGSRIDVTISALGDSESLRGGTLLVTPMLGADGEGHGVVVKPGRYGPYVTDGETNASLREREGDTVEGLTDERAAELLQLRRDAGPAKKRGAKKAAAKKSTSKKSAAKKTTGAKKTAAKKATGAKKAAGAKRTAKRPSSG